MEEKEEEEDLNGARKMMESIGIRDVYAKMSLLAKVLRIAGIIVEKEVRIQLYRVHVRMVQNGKNLKHHAMVDENGIETLKAVLVMEKHMREKMQKEIVEEKARKLTNVPVVMVLFGHQVMTMKNEEED